MTRILVVDDIEDNIKALSFDLLDDGYEVATALSGHQALLEIQQRPPDLVLLDLLMPEMDGFEVCRRMQDNPQRREIPIIVVSALDDHESIVRALDLGAQDYVTKPYYYPIIGARIRAALRQKKERDLLLQLNSDLDHARTMAEAGMRAKTTFLTNISHEVRTPINGITGMAELLKNGPLTAEQEDYRDTIELLSDNLLNMIDEILDYSKIEAGDVFVENKRFHLRTCIDKAVASVREMCLAKSLPLDISVDLNLSSVYIGDSGRIEQILHHLLHNAVKFTGSGSIKLWVQPSPKAAKDDQHCNLHFSISDTGIGFEHDHLETLMGSFSQVDGSTQRRYGGTGLGLAICYQLIDHMGGEITLNSEPDKGTTVDVILPFEVDHSDAPILPGWHGLEDKKILLLSPQPAEETLVIQALQAFGCEVRAVAVSEPFADHLNIDMGGQATPDIIVVRQTALWKSSILKAIKAIGKLGSCPCFLLQDSATSAHEMAGDFNGVLCAPLNFGGWYKTLHSAIAPTVEQTDTPSVAPHLPILLAEDNTVNQKVAQKILDILGYQVDTVSNGLDAVEAVKNKEYGLILMDCQMPDMDGYEATGQIRKLQGLERHIPIIALTAHAMRGDREHCLSAGMDDYLTKPIKVPQLKQTLEHWFNTLDQ